MGLFGGDFDLGATLGGGFLAGGFFGGGDDDNVNLPPPPEFATAGDLLGRGVAFGEEQTPLALGAREGALADILRGNEFFESFQPTSFEQALANQSFQLATQESDRAIKQGLSLSGLESSPILAQQLGQSRERLGVDIGSILAQLGQTRATQSLNARLGIDPIASIIQPIAGFEQFQDQLQQTANFNQAMQKFAFDQAQQQQQDQEASQLAATLGTFAGGAGGFALGGPAGASIGASLGGSLGGAVGGSGQAPSPFSFADALALSGNLSRGGLFGGQQPGTGRTQSQILGQDTRRFANPATLPVF